MVVGTAVLKGIQTRFVGAITLYILTLAFLDYHASIDVDLFVL